MKIVTLLTPLMVAFTIGYSPNEAGDENTPKGNKTLAVRTLPMASEEFPSEIVNFKSYAQNPVFAGTGKPGTWDEKIRERGYILREGNTYHLWYTGYKKEKNAVMHLGYATSPDGLTWTRHSSNPIYDLDWVEDMSVIKSNGVYYMFAEGRNDVAHLLTSTDRIHWQEKGALDVRLTNGNPISEGAYGTPAIWYEKGTWYLYYERGDLGIWLATSKDLKIWTNVQDEPVLKMGPETYDQYAVAMNQIIKYKGLYYGYYHASAFKDWREWSMNVAVSKDLIHWKKYENNPIIGNDKSSGLLVHDGKQYRMYTMHPEVNVYFPNDWIPLFNGTSTEQWVSAKSDQFPKAGWAIDNKILVVNQGKGESKAVVRGGDIITKKMFAQFDLEFEFKLAPGANTGLKYFVKKYPDGSILGCEYQLIDDAGNKDIANDTNDKRRTAGLYELFAPVSRQLKPIGEWNKGRVRVEGTRVMHWLNGVKVVEYTISSPEFMRAKAESKFKDVKDFGTAPGHILLQDHGDEAAFRNIRIREL